jgi:fructokinase
MVERIVMPADLLHGVIQTSRRTRREPACFRIRRPQMNATSPRFDILGIGNAIVDVVAPVPESFITQHDMRKGGMALIDDAAAEQLYAAMPAGTESSGGSVANSCAVAAMMGAAVAYIGRVAQDQLGAVFRHDIGAVGVHFPTAALAGGAPTARCLILVTPDGQRTMNTFLGACVTLGEEDVDPALVADAAVTYLEGYLFDPPAAQAAFRKAADTAHAAGRMVALSLSDAFCVGRHRAAFLDLVANHVDILFANETEITSLYEENDWMAAAEQARADVRVAVLTRGAEGSTILRGSETVQIEAIATDVVDTTGAGDAYAAGFLAAFTAAKSLEACGRAASLAAADVIAQYGARPRGDLSGVLAAVS